MTKRIVGKRSEITDKIWFDVYNPMVVDESGQKPS